MKKPLVSEEFTLLKFQGKGGWTYAEIPHVRDAKKTSFGWVRVRGKIDDHEFKNYKLAPMGDGRLFFPVKAEIRKAIKKEAGDRVHIILFLDDSPLDIPQELIDCLQNAEPAYEKFLELRESQQKEFIDWIYSAKRIATKTGRIVDTIDKLLKGKTL